MAFFVIECWNSADSIRIRHRIQIPRIGEKPFWSSQSGRHVQQFSLLGWTQRFCRPLMYMAFFITERWNSADSIRIWKRIWISRIDEKPFGSHLLGRHIPRFSHLGRAELICRLLKYMAFFEIKCWKSADIRFEPVRLRSNISEFGEKPFWTRLRRRPIQTFSFLGCKGQVFHQYLQRAENRPFWTRIRQRSRNSKIGKKRLGVYGCRSCVSNFSFLGYT